MTTFAFVHVVLNLIGILSWLVVVFGMMGGKRLGGWTTVFLVSAVLTSVSGFFLPFHKLMPSHVLGILSLVALALAIMALYTLRLAGAWRQVYVISAVIALYLNVFVLIAQLFQKVPSLKALAPTGSEPPFLVTELVVMVIFIVLGTLAARRFRTEPVRAS